MSASLRPLEPGSLIDGKLRVERVLGEGGMGLVVSAMHLALEQRVAVKLLRPERAVRAEVHRRFLQEARVASRIASEHVVRVFDLGQTPEGEPYIVMELLEGDDLAAVVEREAPMPLPRAIDLVLQACLGVAAAHAEGLVHRDLKPANLFLSLAGDGAEVVKVLDFGLSKIIDASSPALTRSSSCLGTPQYMAPEQIMSAKDVDGRCDQHALGMILFEMLTRRPPYQGPTSAAVTVAIVTEPAPSARAIRRDLPAPLDAAIRRALAKERDDRFEDVGAFACAIAPFGGRDAVANAARVQRALASRPRPSTAPDPVLALALSPTEPHPEDPPTAQEIPATTAVQLVAGRTGASARRRARPLVVGGAIAIAIAAAAAAAFLGAPGAATVVSAAAGDEGRSAADVERASAEDEGDAEAARQVTATTPPVIEAIAVEATSAAKPARGARRPAAPPATPSARTGGEVPPVPEDPGEVFATRREAEAK